MIAGTFFVVMSVGVFSLYLDTPPSPWLVSVWMLTVAATTAALVVRRHRPWTALAGMLGCALVAAVSPFGGMESFLIGSITALAIPVGLYSLAVHRSTRDGWLGLVASAFVSIMAALLANQIVRAAGLALSEVFSATGVAGGESEPVSVSSWAIVVMLLATLVGINVGNRKRYVGALVDRAAQLARERDQQSQLAASAERARIAREMHDIVSHSLSVMVSLADGSVAAIAENPARSRIAMDQVAETGRHALADMRRMLGVLIDEPPASATGGAALQPQPSIEDLADLVDTFRTAGLPVTFASTGVPPADPVQQLTVYRIVQESLTNALRYATGASEIDVIATFTPDSVSVRIDDDGRADAPVSPGSGRGLVGMRERIALYAGTLESGPRPGGGWRVYAAFMPENESAVTPPAALSPLNPLNPLSPLNAASMSRLTTPGRTGSAQ